MTTGLAGGLAVFISCEKTNIFIHSKLPHLLCYCPALARDRVRTLGKRFFEDLREISGCRGRKAAFLRKCYGLTLKILVSWTLSPCSHNSSHGLRSFVASKRRNIALIRLLRTASDTYLLYLTR